MNLVAIRITLASKIDRNTMIILPIRDEYENVNNQNQ